MDLDQLLLRKEELPILHGHCFQVPIHPRLLGEEVNIDPRIAVRVFRLAAGDWFQDLTAYHRDLADSDPNKRWIGEAFLRDKLEVREDHGGLRIDRLGWGARVRHSDNGFARVLELSCGSGCLYFTPEDRICEGFVPFLSNNKGYIRLEEEKAREFSFEEFDTKTLKGVAVHTYAPHNIDGYPQALFLRNWAIFYLNEAMKSALG